MLLPLKARYVLFEVRFLDYALDVIYDFIDLFRTNTDTPIGSGSIQEDIEEGWIWDGIVNRIKSLKPTKVEGTNYSNKYKSTALVWAGGCAAWIGSLVVAYARYGIGIKTSTSIISGVIVGGIAAYIWYNHVDASNDDVSLADAAMVGEMVRATPLWSFNLGAVASEGGKVLDLLHAFVTGKPPEKKEDEKDDSIIYSTKNGVEGHYDDKGKFVRRKLKASKAGILESEVDDSTKLNMGIADVIIEEETEEEERAASRSREDDDDHSEMLSSNRSNRRDYKSGKHDDHSEMLSSNRPKKRASSSLDGYLSSSKTTSINFKDLGPVGEIKGNSQEKIKRAMENRRRKKEELEEDNEDFYRNGGDVRPF